MPANRTCAVAGRCRTATGGVVTVLAAAVLLAVVLVAVVLVARGPAGGSTVTGSGDAASPDRAWGVTMPGVPGDTAPVQQLAAGLGHRPGIVMWYSAWSAKPPFPAAGADRARAAGAVPEVTWEPWDPAAGVDQPAYALTRIAGGAFDAYLRSWADAIRGWGHPLRLRFAHEMNGSWYPWAAGVNGNSAGAYVAAWRHVHDVFAAAGADNVTWIWSPNVPFDGSTPLADVFPGDDAVDEVALDGYNWAGLQPNTAWTSFANTFGPGVHQLQHLSARPIGIGEVGCPEADAPGVDGAGASKAAWLAGMWQTLGRWPQVRTLIWFDYDKEADWRVESSAASLAAFAAGISGFDNS